MDAGTKLTRQQMERRRLEAASVLLEGGRQAHLAEKFGVSRTTACRWYHAVLRGGPQSLLRRQAKGRPSHLTPDQWGRLSELIQRGARACGFPTDEWTTSRLATAIAAEFGVHYQTDHVRRLRKRLLPQY